MSFALLDTPRHVSGGDENLSHQSLVKSPLMLAFNLDSIYGQSQQQHAKSLHSSISNTLVVPPLHDAPRPIENINVHSPPPTCCETSHFSDRSRRNNATSCAGSLPTSLFSDFDIPPLPQKSPLRQISPGLRQKMELNDSETASTFVEDVQTESGGAVHPGGTKVSGLMRKLSRGAANIISRKRQTPVVDQRDHSSGPILIRRRSQSRKKLAPKAQPMLGRNNQREQVPEATETWYGPDGDDIAIDYHQSLKDVEFDGVGPKVDPLIQRGCVLVKVSKQKRKQRTFFLDLHAAKIFWDASAPSKRLYIDDIKAIHTGADARNYREEQQVAQEFEDRWVTIVFANPERSKNRPMKTMHLIAPNKRIIDLFTTTIEKISQYRIGIMAGLASSSHCEATLKAHWRREILKHGSQTNLPEPSLSQVSLEEKSLDLGAIEDVCKSLHINCPRNAILAQFHKADSDNNGRLNFVQFKSFLRKLNDRKDLREIFNTVTSTPSYGMTFEEFFRFLHDVQAENINNEEVCLYWRTVYKKFVFRNKACTPISSTSELQDTANLSLSPTNASSDSDFQELPRMNFDAFAAFLMSPFNSIYPSNNETPTLDRPLNEYFISSSHNTYLLGRQVAGESSTEAYITALQKGCRCLEIDCWDGADGRPIVSHGRTMTTSVLFADCITVINRYAFVSSEYPLILSLEVHCNAEQQIAMANIMKDTFGEHLLLEPLDMSSKKLPSPEELKNRILVKVKTSADDVLPDSDPSPPSSPAPIQKRSSSFPGALPTIESSSKINITQNHYTNQKAADSTKDGPTSSNEFAESLRHGSSVKQERKKPVKRPTTKELAELSVYTRGYKWRGFGSPESRSYNHVFSFAERAVEGICKDTVTKNQFEVHNRKYLSRVYPSTFRVNSSNFDPNSFWKRGVQMVALNWQTFDVGMEMNQAMFAAGSDRLGYVLKPEGLRRKPPANAIVTATGKPKIEKQLVQFQIDVISAQQLPRPNDLSANDTINPYVEVEVFSADDRQIGGAYGEGGVNASARKDMSGLGHPHRRRTKIKLRNGYNPVFNDKFKISLETKYPDLVFVRWTVFNCPDGRSTGSNNNVQLASFTAKLSRLSQGYRYLPLYADSGDQYLFSRLFCKISRSEQTSFHIPFDYDSDAFNKVGIFKQLGQAVFKRSASTRSSTN